MGYAILRPPLGYPCGMQLRGKGDLHGRGNDSHGRPCRAVDSDDYFRCDAIEKRSYLRDHVRLRQDEEIFATYRSNQTAAAISRSPTWCFEWKLCATVQGQLELP